MYNEKKEALMIKKLCLTLCVSLLLCVLSGSSMAEVNVNIGVNVPLPPPFVFPAPPEVIVIPGTSAYYPPAVDVDIVFYRDYWYRPYANHWYRSRSYNGPWVFIAPERLPRVIISLPPDYRHVPPGHRYIPYGHVKRQWRSWEREKYWDKHDWKYEEKERNGKSRGRYKEEKHEHKQKGKHGKGHD